MKNEKIKETREDLEFKCKEAKLNFIQNLVLSICIAIVFVAYFVSKQI